MKRWLRVLVVGVVLMMSSVSSPHAAADTSPQRGLLISPPRYSVEVAAGKSDTQEITVGNDTDQTLDITLNIQEFSVANLSYEYQIRDVDQPWVYIQQPTLQLEAGARKTLPFTVQPPLNASPGGKYYLIVASARTKKGALTSTLQVAAPIYITVNGKLDYSSRLENNHTISQLIILGDRIPFQLDVTNTGNTHYIIDVVGKLEGVFGTGSTSSTQHIILPDTTRKFQSSLPTPFFPGVYRATYGYSSDNTGATLVRTWVVYLPPWAIIGSILVIWGTLMSIRALRKRKPTTDSQPPQYT